MASRRGASAGHAATSWGSASLLAQPLSQQVDLLGNMELLWVREKYGNRITSTHTAAVSMDIYVQNSFSHIAKCPHIKVVACLLAAAIADPLGAGAVGDGCELQKVSKEEEKEFVHS